MLHLHNGPQRAIQLALDGVYLLKLIENDDQPPLVAHLFHQRECIFEHDVFIDSGHKRHVDTVAQGTHRDGGNKPEAAHQVPQALHRI